LRAKAVSGIVHEATATACLAASGIGMSVLLGAQGLTKAFGVRPLFSDLSFDIREGERIGLIGPNGAGKSTLLKMLAGTLPADAGIRAIRRSARLAFVAQDDVFTPGHTIRQVVLDALANDGSEEHEKETAASIALTQVGFDDDSRPAAQLSGGWRKRLSIARALAQKPDLLLMDEPTNHLDLPGIVWLERLLRGAPFGYVVATHDRAFLRAEKNAHANPRSRQACGCRGFMDYTGNSFRPQAHHAHAGR
ncbi:MAG: ATP-binding cassette domain-containing protein, partial [Planctomycetaceae bacterium]